jgi:hypothetical protein
MLRWRHTFWLAQPRGLETIDTVTVCVIPRAVDGSNPKGDQGAKARQFIRRDILIWLYLYGRA